MKKIKNEMNRIGLVVFIILLGLGSIKAFSQETSGADLDVNTKPASPAVSTGDVATTIAAKATTSAVASDKAESGSEKKSPSNAATSATTDAKVDFDINKAKAKKSLVAFPSLIFLGNSASVPSFNSIGTELSRIINNDLTVSGFFQFVNAAAFLEDTSKTGIKPFPEDPKGFKFESWKTIGAEFLVRGSYTVAGENLTLEVFVYQVSKSKLMFGKKYKGTVGALRRIAHTFTNDFMQELTGAKGMFLSRIVVASDRGGNKYREIYVMDWDSANIEKITNHKSVALSPSWSPDGQRVAYTAFVQRTKTKIRNADLFIFELFTGKRWLVSYREGINSGSNFAPDGKYIFLTLSQQGTPDIFKMTYDGTLVSKITNGPRGAMNVEPAVSPDGTKIAFSSDRSGQPMIYVMNVDGTNVQRRTFAGRYNSTPAWSPDGKRLAFAGWENDHFDIFTMNADGTNMVRITSSKKKNGKWANNEDPVFSPDGRLLMYTSNRSGPSQIYISDLEGEEERNITNDSHNYFKPRWSNNFE